MKITTKVMNINPITAERFLRKNIINRPLYEATIEKYALDMKRGRWALNHQGICFDEEGNLFDGQHRLRAIIRSGKTVKMLVISGMPSTFQISNDGNLESCRTQLTVDGGKLRGVGDQLNLNFGITNANLKAAITRAIIEICTGKGNLALSALSIKEIYDLYESEIEAISARKKGVPGLIVAGALGGMAFAAKSFRKEALDFEEHYFSGADLSKDSPILIYRNFMLNRNKGQTLHPATRRIIISHGLNALRHFVLQQPLSRLVSTTQGLEFFSNKQKKAVTDVIETVRL